VVLAVTGQESDRYGVVGEDVNGSRGKTPRRRGVHDRDRDVAIEFLEAGAANNGDSDGPWCALLEMGACGS